MDGEGPFSRFKVGEFGDNGEKIIAIAALENDYVIYITESGKTGFDAKHELMNCNKKEIEYFDSINSKIFNLLPKASRKYPAQQLAYALSGCFVYDDESGMSLLKNCEKLVNDKLNEVGRFVYLLSAIVFCGILIILLYWNNSPIKGIVEPAQFSVLQYGGLGVLGAIISVLHRLNDIETQGFFGYKYIALQGFVRMLIGFTFGLLSYFLVKGNVIFGILATSEYGFIIASVVAGFSERAIPETVDRIQI